MTEHEHEHDEELESPLDNEGLKGYVAGILPGAATEMEAVLQQIEEHRDDFPPPDGYQEE